MRKLTYANKRAEADIMDNSMSVLLWIIVAVILGLALYFLFKGLGVW